MHAKELCHRDLKLENVMLEAEPHSFGLPRAKLIDFGFATTYTMDY